jgi:hypothetical protein
MKLIITAIIILTSLFTASMTGAQKLYTWTDEKGNLHITEDPPPKTAKIEETVTYKQRSPEEEAARQRRNEEFRRRLEQDKQRVEKRDTRVKASDAEKDAQKMKEQAWEEYEENKAYIDKLSNRRWKRKKFRKRIERLKKESEESLAAAEEAAKRAREAKAAAEAEQDTQ